MKKIVTALALLVICFSARSQTWSTVGPGIDNSNGRIEAMCEYNGELYVGGYFDSIAGMRVNSLAKWNGVSWDSVPDLWSFNHMEILVMTVYNNELVIGGSVTGNGASYIAKYNGITWSILAGGVDNKVHGLAVYNNELFVAGDFVHANGITSRGIARWNGTAWNNVGGPGLNQTNFQGKSMKIYNNDLYLSGGFYSVNGMPAPSIAKWNGTTWSNVGVINPSGINSLNLYHNKIYASGALYVNSDTLYSTLCNWDSNAWDSVPGLKGWPVVMETYNDELYVAGKFDTAGSIKSYGIARWNDVQWDSVGSGIDQYHITEIATPVSMTDTVFEPTEYICSMCVYQNELYVGGYFSMIGGINANCIARWHMVGASVNEQNKPSGISIFPVPASDHLTIKFQSTASKTEVRIYDLMGELKSKIISSSTTINIAGLDEGIYILEVRDGNSLSRQKFIKVNGK